MREIKFRAWDKEEAKMFDVYAIDWGAKQVIVSCHSDSRKYYPHNEMGDKIVFMQFTGLKDKNGKEIYEGDVLETNSRDVQHLDKKWRMIYVDFDNAHFRFNAIGQEGKEYNLLYRLETWKPKVIGNIYENPELLTPPTPLKAL